MTTQYKCSECHTVFSDHDAYCENWRDPNKNFGCPGCKAMFRKMDIHLRRYKWVSFIYSSGVLVPSLILGPDMVRSANVTTLLLFGMLLVSSTALFFLHAKAATRKYWPTERVPS